MLKNIKLWMAKNEISWGSLALLVVLAIMLPVGLVLLLHKTVTAPETLTMVEWGGLVCWAFLGVCGGLAWIWSLLKVTTQHMIKSSLGTVAWITILVVTWNVYHNKSDNEADNDYNAGYQDGYASGYNTTCKIRATLINGDWDNRNYSRGYAEGHENGIVNCLADQR